ncbi:glycosyltransferase family 9 protein [Ignavibacteria bacterium CHB1]|mgnify:FL=1|nr:hypothetical protein [Ignavibacteria bacterium]MCC6885360.1 glycosyltransferase family 9 protein [Ignavibacteriales bacterium]MDL1887507.1 glycosyltransferase family 9 protein [Ignavibacteria bacterium CHB1]
MNLINSDIKNILVIKMCCLGDVVQILPAVNIIKQNFPDAKITLLADKWVEPLKVHLTDFDDFIVVNNTFSRNLFQKASTAIWLINKLIKRKFDFALIGHRNNAFGCLTYLAGIKYRLGFSETKHVNIASGFDDKTHEAQRYLSILASCGLNTDNFEVGIKATVSKAVMRNRIGIPLGNSVIGIFPFGGINPGMDMRLKRWELEKFKTVGYTIVKKFPDYSVIFFEGKYEDEKYQDKFFQPGFFKINIGINEINACDKFIGNDTGSLHIANALGIKTIGIFGPTDPDVFGPLNTGNFFPLVHKINCSPCFNHTIAVSRTNRKYWQGNKFLCHEKHHRCIKDLDVDKLFEIL